MGVRKLVNGILLDAQLAVNLGKSLLLGEDLTHCLALKSNILKKVV